MEKDELLLIKGTDFRQMTIRLLEEADLKKMIPSHRTRITIKPNLVGQVLAQEGGTTHPEVVAGLIEYLQGYGFENLTVMEGSWVGDRTMDAVRYCGYDKMLEKYQVPFLDMQREPGIARDCGGMELNICAAALETEFLINVPVLKGHCQTRVTCALKNMKGLIPNSEKRRFHRMGLHKPIAHLSCALHQDFILVDNICGDLTFEDGGDPVIMNRLIAARDPVLCDAFASTVVGTSPKEVEYIMLADELGSGSADLQKARIRYVQGQRQANTETAAQADTMTAAQADPMTDAQADPGAADQASTDTAARASTETAAQASMATAAQANTETTADWLEEVPASDSGFRKVMRLAENVNEVESCSACYGYLIPALQMLDEEGLLDQLKEKICIGQGYKGQAGELGIGNCTRLFRHTCEGCPPTENQMYAFLKHYILTHP